MPKELPVVCSLGAGDLQQRLAAIGAVSLVDRRFDGGRHLLRFRSDATTRARLDGIAAAEAECCAFLDLSLQDDGDALILSISAPEAGHSTAAALAAAFEGSILTNVRRPNDERAHRWATRCCASASSARSRSA